MVLATRAWKKLIISGNKVSGSNYDEFKNEGSSDEGGQKEIFKNYSVNVTNERQSSPIGVSGAPAF